MSDERTSKKAASSAGRSKKPALPEIPEHLVKRIAAGHGVAFVGAGLSQSAGLPGWSGALQRLMDWGEKNGIKLKNPNALKTLLKEKRFFLVAEIIRKAFTPSQFQRAMREIFQPPGLQPSFVHESLMQIPFAGMLTTNYDKLLETAYTKQHGKAPLVYTQLQAPELALSLQNDGFWIGKIHGTVDQIQSVVLAREDYQQAMYNNPAYQAHLQTIFTARTVLFIGFGLDDPDLNAALDELSQVFQGYAGPHYAFLPSSGPVSKMVHADLRERWGIEVLAYRPSTTAHPEVEQFLQALKDRLKPPAAEDPGQRLAKAQALLGEKRRLLDQQKEKLSAEDYLKKRFAIAREQWSSGNKRTAWTSFLGLFQREGNVLPTEDRVRMGVELSEMMQEDDVSDQAEMVILPLESELSTVNERDLQCRYWTVRAEVLADNFRIDHAVEAFARASELTPDEQKRERMQARIAEVRFLSNSNGSITSSGEPSKETPQ